MAKRLIVRAPKWYCNLPIDKITCDDGMVAAERDGELVGVFDLGAIDALYVSEEGKEQK